MTVTGTTVRITDDDASPTVTLSLSDASIGEDAGVSTVTASLSHASSVATTVTVSVSPDTPATTSDYSLSANKVLTIAAGGTASTGTVTVTGVDNDVDAADKTVQVKGAASNTVGTTGPADVELTLKDDDTIGHTVARGDGIEVGVGHCRGRRRRLHRGADLRAHRHGDGDACAQQRRYRCDGVGRPDVHGGQLEHGADGDGECGPGRGCGR